MKRYDELMPEQQQKATDKALTDLLEAVVSGTARFDDMLNKNTLQASIDAAMQEAEDHQTPWFAHEYILEAVYTDEYTPEADQPCSVKEMLLGMATCDAEDSLYSEVNDPPVVQGIA